MHAKTIAAKIRSKEIAPLEARVRGRNAKFEICPLDLRRKKSTLYSTPRYSTVLCSATLVPQKKLLLHTRANTVPRKAEEQILPMLFIRE